MLILKMLARKRLCHSLTAIRVLIQSQHHKPMKCIYTLLQCTTYQWMFKHTIIADQAWTGWGRTLPCPTYSRWTPPESRWFSGVHLESRCIYLAGSTAKLTCIIHLDFTRTPGGLQMNDMESVESTCQIPVWILPGLNPGSIHQESRRSLLSSEFILLYF